MSPTIELAQQLISRPSVTPLDEGCQQLIANRLSKVGFRVEHMPFGEVSNLWLRLGDTAPLVVYAGHTDVVPTGDEAQWTHPPFSANLVNGNIMGRGAADMKGSVAAAVIACESFAKQHTAGMRGSLAMLITSDEEGPALDGTVKVIEALQARDEQIDYCVVGEPTSSNTLGDLIKNGRRGSLGLSLIVHGTQGHVAYPHLADNPVHRALPLITELTNTKWDEGDDNFPPTTLQISNASAGTGATNVIPGDFHIELNLRYSPASPAALIKSTIEKLIEQHKVKATVQWKDSAHPFITEPGSLTQAMQQSIKAVTGTTAELNTGGGTSDGRFIAPVCKQVIEFGPTNASIHQINEHTSCEDLNSLTAIYENLFEQLLVIGEHHGNA
ncbi:MAG: succinyl-diaminopimelate desuccinylase [Granulosicoccaceae bacterium]